MDFIENFTIPFYNIQIDNWSTKNKSYWRYVIRHNWRSILHHDLQTIIQFQKFIVIISKNITILIKYLKFLREDLNKFSNKIQTSCSLDNVWFQRYTKGNFHSPHDHGPRGYSSICFIEYDKNEHNPPRFLCPFKSVYGSYKEYSPDNVTEGTIIFFPSMLIHYVVPTTSDKIRTIMSMNIGI